MNYLFKSERLGFRNWLASDTEKMIAISSTENIMRFFPAIATPKQTEDFIQRMKHLFNEKGYCYFAVDLLATSEFIGFIGLNDITYEAPFSPGTDIGWRLDEKHWGKGFATEGALCCLNYAGRILNKKTIIATAPEINIPSISVMTKIGMTKKLHFNHPKLTDYPGLEKCVCYEIRLN